MTITLTLPGPPRTKKTSQRIVRFGRNRQHVKVMPSEQYLEWEQTILAYAGRIRSDLQGVTLPITAPVEIEARVFRQTRTGDLAGYLQAIGDVIQAEVIRKDEHGVPKLVRRGLGIIRDDALIERWDASLDHDPANPRIELRISTLQPQQEALL